MLDSRVLGALQDRLEQQWVLGDPLMGFGLHVPEPHPLTLRMSLHPLDTQQNFRVINVEHGTSKQSLSFAGRGVSNGSFQKSDEHTWNRINKPIFQHKNRCDILVMFIMKATTL